MKINSTGKIKTGNDYSPSTYNGVEDPDDWISLAIRGRLNTTDGAGGKLSFGDFGSTYGRNVFIGEYQTYDSDVLQLQGKNGVYITSTADAASIIATFDPWGDLKVQREIFAQGLLVSSDVRLKKNIKNLTGSLAIVNKLQGIKYDFKTEKEDSLLLVLERTQTTNEKDAKSKAETKKRLEDIKKQSVNKAGFSAQEMQMLLPSSVYTDSNGKLAVNYIEVIPILVEAIKEQQTQIEAMKKEIELLKKK
ncbi:MAG: tail fiber domain-containing protein [Saprospiraceae bacterium]|nr:tail fiber domain-containing protein [Saprospiraceae bacterium]